MLFLFFSRALLLAIAFAQTDFIVTPSSYQIQVTNDYLFQMSASEVGPVSANSSIVVMFPSAYVSSASQTFNCSKVSWPFAITNLSCTMAFNNLTILGGFPVAFSDFTNVVTFAWTISSISNPLYAQTTSYFQGVVQDKNNNLIFPFYPVDGLGLTIFPGSLTISLSMSPTTVDASSIMTVQVTPTNPIPANGILRLTFKSFWETNVFNITKIIADQPTCNQLNNTALNLFCSLSTTADSVVMTVSNLFTAQTSSPFSFTIFPMLNPPTTQPQGNFSVTSYSGSVNSLPIDISTNNKISNISPAPITSVSVVMANYSISSSSPATIKAAISNIIQSTDIIYINCPPEISLINLSQVVMFGTIGSSLLISNNLISFTGIAINNVNQITIILNNLTLPAYAMTTTSFSIWISRNTFNICKIDNAFQITTLSGNMVASILPTILSAGDSSNYKIVMSLSNPVDSFSKLQFQFDQSQFNLQPNLTCLSTAQTPCSILLTSNNTLQATNFASTPLTSLNLTIVGVINPWNIGKFSSIVITSLAPNSAGQFLEVNVNRDLNATFSVTPHYLTVADVIITSSSYIVYAIANLTLQITTKNFIPANSIIRVVVPSEISFGSSISCNSPCAFFAPQVIDFYLISSVNASTTSVLVIYFARMPTSTQPTHSFSVIVVDNLNNTLQLISAGLSVSMVSGYSFLTQIQRNSSTNGAMSQYNASISLPFSLASSVVQMIVPASLSCQFCSSTIWNASFNLIRFPNSSLATGSIVIVIDGIINYFSFEPVTIEFLILTDDELFLHGHSSLQLTNNLPSALSFSSYFLSQMLLEPTSLIVNDIVDSSIKLIKILFSSDFNANNVTCTSSTFACIRSNSQVTFSVSGALFNSTLQMDGLIAPSASPSNLITISSYSNNTYLISSGTLRWTTKCLESCRTCPSSNLSSCMSCYSNSLLVSSQIVFNPVNVSCVAACGDLFYLNSTDQVCYSCSSACTNCLNFSICTSCPSAKYLLSSNHTCWSTCPNGYFASILTMLCQPCTQTLNCFSCNNEVNCSACANPYFYSIGACVLSCPINSIANETSRNCDSCPSSCLFCSLKNSTVICSGCVPGLLLDNGICTLTCITIGTIPYNSLTCNSCYYKCLTCISSLSNCLTCNTSSSYKYFYNNNCLDVCNPGFYADSSFSACLPCVSPCQTCLNSSFNYCFTCISGYSLFGNECKSACPSLFYSNSQSNCSACVSPCLTCTSQSICLSCVQNSTLYVSSCLPTCPDGYANIFQVCSKCSSNCKTCATITFCMSCFNNTYLLNGSCQSPCPIGHFSDSQLLVCLSCNYTCSSCINMTFCTVCSKNYQLSINNTCTSSCLSNEIAVNSICSACSSNCATCQNAITSCISCVTGFWLIPSVNSCLSTCPAPFFAYFINKTCLVQCPNSNTYYVDPFNSSIRICSSCSLHCSVCLSPTFCVTCDSGWLFSNNTCISTCPSTAPYNINAICLTCNIVDCYECENETCLQCIGGKLLIGNTLCISTCGSYSFYNTSTKTCTALSQNNQSTSNNTTTPTTSLSFLPLPLLILAFILTLIALPLHYLQNVSISPTLMAIYGTLFQFCAVATLISYIFQTNSDFNQVEVWLIISGVTLSFILSLICCLIYWSKIGWEKCIVLVFSAFISLQLNAILNSNINNYVSIDNPLHLSFWKSYNRIVKVSFLYSLVNLAGGIKIVFSANETDKSQYFYFSGIELAILSLINMMSCCFWLSWSSVKVCQVESLDIWKENESIQNMQEKMKDLNVSGMLDNNREAKTDLAQWDQHSQADHQSPKYHSNYQYNHLTNALQMSRNHIPDAIEQGLFRKNQQDILRDQQASQEFNMLDSAERLNQIITHPLNHQSNIFDAECESIEPNHIFPKQDEEKQPSKQYKKKYQASKQDERKDQSSNEDELALNNQPIVTKEEDFAFNIIYLDEEDDPGSHQTTLDLHEPTVAREKNGQQNKDIKKANVVYVEPTKQADLFINQKSIFIQDIEDEEESESRYNIFSHEKGKQYEQITGRKIESNQIIYADFEEILTVSEPSSVEWIESKEQIKVQKIKAKIIEQMLDLDFEEEIRPSELLLKQKIVKKEKEKLRGRKN